MAIPLMKALGPDYIPKLGFQRLFQLIWLVSYVPSLIALLCNEYIPTIWKCANLAPSPKVTPLNELIRTSGPYP